MSKIASLLVSLGVIALFLLASSASGVAQDAAEVNPDTITVKVDNDQVRVLEAVIEPGQKERLHSHPACVTYVIAGGQARVHDANGSVADVTLTAGDVAYRGPVTHWGENVGKTTIRLILVELKTPE